MQALNIEDDWKVFDGIDEETGACKFVTMEKSDFKKALGVWTGGSNDTSKGHGTFLMFSPVELGKKKAADQWHVWCSPFDPTDQKRDNYPARADNYMEAIVHAAKKMTVDGEVWVKEIWDKDGEEGKYPLGHKEGFRNPVFCAFKHEGEFYGFTLIEDDNKYYRTYADGAKVYKGKQRSRKIKMTAANLAKEFVGCNLDGCFVSWKSRKHGAVQFHNIDEVTTKALEEIIESCPSV